ncbi:MAG: YraN family protein [Clostridia bacterium]|nr:YraN family protein [Clostridia bacterium]
MISTTAKGRKAEALVCQYIEQKGYTVMHRNFYCSCGEIDIVAENDDTILLIEVRMRKKGAAVSGAESITAKKADTMRQCAMEYYQRARMPDFAMRIDAAQVEYEDTPNGVQYSIEYFENALSF